MQNSFVPQLIAQLGTKGRTPPSIAGKPCISPLVSSSLTLVTEAHMRATVALRAGSAEH